MYVYSHSHTHTALTYRIQNTRAYVVHSIRMTLKLVGFEFSDRIPLFFFLCSKTKEARREVGGLVNFKTKWLQKPNYDPLLCPLEKQGKGLICWTVVQSVAQSLLNNKNSFCLQVIDPVLGPRLFLRVQQRLTVGSC